MMLDPSEKSSAGGATSSTSIPPRLGLWDTVSIIVGIVVGTAIFRSPPGVFSNAGGPLVALALWLVGGVLAWCGAVCYAELATKYPRDGGDYEYLNRAFGPWCGFLFAWAQLTTVISGNIAIMAYAFADYGLRLWPEWERARDLVGYCAGCRTLGNQCAGCCDGEDCSEFAYRRKGDWVGGFGFGGVVGG